MSKIGKVSDVDVLRIYTQPFEVDGKTRDRRLAESLGLPIKVIWRAFERCERKGYIECGVTLRSGWLTDAGKQRLGSASTHPDELTMDLYPVYANHGSFPEGCPSGG